MDPQELCGAILDPKEAAAFQAALPIKSYGDLPRADATGQKRFLWEFERQVMGQDFWEIQTIGDCVSKGIQRAAVMLWCTRIALNGFNESVPGVPASEAIYALGRHEIGHDRLGTEDGLVVGWGLQGVMDYGILLRGVYGGIDLTTYSGQRAKIWGAPGAGLPNQLEPIARQLPVKAAVPIKSWQDGINAMYNGEPLFGGSNHIPALRNGIYLGRDALGFINLGGRGAHCTIFTGFDDNEGWWMYDNASWSEMPGPNPVNGPVRGGKVHRPLVEQMLGEGEWYALSDETSMPNQADQFMMI
ncbi:MAG TPA: hypothetical protein VGR71_13470 [Nitrospira sp.]|nr:hypothetical protein [Nitrospira sp.]